ncbi:hypothetical protein R1sor_027352 [Riccia sorocarpa]|uniref:CCHC-type domain-containing protein n=1 Tax=Riccia sorocarpa TaxID=122646 RepID=A0ABD3GJQ0_9MARC
MVLVHTRASFNFSRGNDYSSPLKKKSRALGEEMAKNLEGMANASGAMSPGGKIGGGSPDTRDGSMRHIIFSNLCFKQQVDSLRQGYGANSINGTNLEENAMGGDANANYLEEFPLLCKRVEEVTPDLVEPNVVANDPKLHHQSWKNVAEKSLLERHPSWANANSAVGEPNPYVKGLRAEDSKTVSTDKLREVVWDVNSSVSVEEFTIGNTIQVDKGFFARSIEQQNKALIEGLYKIHGRMVFTFPSDPKCSPRELQSELVPVWVDLPKVHPLLEPYGAMMLSTVGKVLYKTCEARRDSHIHIRCVLTFINRRLKDHVTVKLEEVDEPMVQPVWYTSLPNVCFLCHQRDHIAKDCPAFREEEPQKMPDVNSPSKEGSEATNELGSGNDTPSQGNQNQSGDGFIPVKPYRIPRAKEAEQTVSCRGPATHRNLVRS